MTDQQFLQAVRAALEKYERREIIDPMLSRLSSAIVKSRSSINDDPRRAAIAALNTWAELKNKKHIRKVCGKEINGTQTVTIECGKGERLRRWVVCSDCSTNPGRLRAKLLPSR